MPDQENISSNGSAVEWGAKLPRFVAASFTLVTVHYIGFFSRITEDYYFIMSTSLVKRVTWELISTLANTSLVIAVLFLVLGILKGIGLGISRSFLKQERAETETIYEVSISTLLMPYLAIFLVHYLSPDVPRGFFATAGLVLIISVYLIFFKEVKRDTRWSRFVSPLRHRELGVRALIAVSLLIAYFSGSGLASSLLSKEPMRIVTDGKQIDAVVIDSTSSAFLILRDDVLELLPMHKVDRIILSENSAAPVKSATND